MSEQFTKANNCKESQKEQHMNNMFYNKTAQSRKTEVSIV